MLLIDHPHPPEQIIRLDDSASGLEGVIVLHSTKLGPAAGGCRLWHYPSLAETASDALRLAIGMSYKNALAGLPLGGGKAVIRHPRRRFDRRRLFQVFGETLAKLDGRYLTTEDDGTTVEDMMVVAESSNSIVGFSAPRPAGDPSPWTALGVVRAMEVAVRQRLRAQLSDITVAVQGLGNVGFTLCGLLHEAGAKLVVAEPRSEAREMAVTRFGARVVSPAKLFESDVDVLAPCALAGILTSDSIRRLRAKVICGAANDQLAHATQGDQLHGRNILYAPDYVVNAGGIINVAAQHFGWHADETRYRVDRIGQRLGEVISLAKATNGAPHRAAEMLARSLLSRRTLSLFPADER